MKYVVTFGEVLMRFSPPGHERIIQCDHFHSRYSGAEANVAVSLAYYGDKVRFVSKFPDNILGDAAENEIRRFGVDTSFCARGGDRLGIYFTERGTSQRATTVLYDRSGSSFSTSENLDYDWERIFQDCEWFHISGIDIALNKQVFQICKDACEIANGKNVKICLDINYRSLLVDKETFMERITQILPHVDLLVGNEQEIAMLAGREIPLIELDDYDKYIDKCYQSAVIVQEQYHVDTIAASLRKQKSASETSWSGMVLCGEEILINSRYEIKVEEVIGCGDAFVAGLLHSLLKGKSIQDAIGFAVSASCLKHTIEGDFNLVKEYEVEQLIDNYVYGIVKR